MINSIGLLLGLVLMLGISVLDWWKQEAYLKPASHFSMLSEYAIKLSTLPSAEQELGKKLLFEAYDKAERKYDSFKDRTIVVDNLSSELMQQEAVIAELHQEHTFSEGYFQKLAEALNIFAGTYRQLLSLKYQEFTIYKLNHLLFEGLFVALGSAMFALLGFYVASAAYRAFRIRSFESGLMMLAAIIVMLGQIPFGIWIWDGFPALRLWLLEVPNSAAFRGIALGAGVASLIMALRMWLSLETDPSTGDRS